MAPDISVVIPIFNESRNIAPLQERLGRVLDELGRAVEVWYVDDGSSDDSLALLCAIAGRDARVGVIELARNAGQHAAVLAGFAASRDEHGWTIAPAPPAEKPGAADE